MSSTKHLLTLVCLAISSLTIAQEAKQLPSEFTTTKGQKITGAKLTGQGPDSIKVMHDGGIATLPVSQLPKEVLTALGLEATESSAVDSYKLPSPFETTRTSYTEAELMAVEPDGIRIKHTLGTAKVPYEELPEQVKSDLGPFDPSRATAFREAQAEQNRMAQQAAREALKKATAANYAASIEAQKREDQHKEDLLKNPRLVSPRVFVELIAYSQGGKNRDTSWATTYGSFARTDVSTRKMYCTIVSKAGGVQRVRLQCLFLIREVDGAKDLLYEVAADDLVSLGKNAQKSVVASAQAEQSDENYAALGLRVKEGVKYVGWCWRAIDGLDRVTAVYSSTPAYDKYGWSIEVKKLEE